MSSTASYGPAASGFILAAVWLGYGVWCKLLGRVPRHRLIVARALGERLSVSATRLIGAGEVGLAVWILSGVQPRVCAVVQTATIVCMNAVEFTIARDLLLAPMPMLAVNAGLLSLAWYWALAGVR